MSGDALPGRAVTPVLPRPARSLELLLLAAVVGTHALAITLLVPVAPDVGHSTPVLRYPVRVRLLEGAITTVASTPANDGVALTAPIAPAPQALIPEGRIDVAPENYAPTSERYFPVVELGQRPAAINLPSLDALLINPLAHGSVTLRLFINEIGSVDRIEVDDSTVPPEILARLLAMREQMQFTPGMRNGANVKSQVVYAVDLAPAEIKTLVSGAKASPL